MKRVTGIGGVFFEARAPDELKAWYVSHLGLPSRPDGDVMFEWREGEGPDRQGETVWSPFPRDTDYFEPSQSPFMINCRVADLDGLPTQLRRKGVEGEEWIEEYPYSRFAWIMDSEGNRVELWEPPEKY
ncbi:MAG: VOC family protein [Candidatus Thermoplasmatota archaeon]|nr:VOC family protein [Candidatus Thermoplasmatota archaeon]